MASLFVKSQAVRCWAAAWNQSCWRFVLCRPCTWTTVGNKLLSSFKSSWGKLWYFDVFCSLRLLLPTWYHRYLQLVSLLGQDVFRRFNRQDASLTSLAVFHRPRFGFVNHLTNSFFLVWVRKSGSALPRKGLLHGHHWHINSRFLQTPFRLLRNQGPQF